MNDRELLDLLAQDAPEVRPDFPQEVTMLAKQARRRRRLAGIAVTAAAVVTASVAGTVFALGSDAQHSTRVQAVPPSKTPDPQATAYATAIKSAIGRNPEPQGGKPPILYVVSHTCSNVDKAPPLVTCTGAPLGVGLQIELAKALTPYNVVFIPSARDGINPSTLMTKNNGVQIVLSPIRYSGSDVGVPVAVHRGPLDGEGLVVWLTRQSGQWVVLARPPVGTTGGGWIS